jgi:hypothetical protein
MVKWTVQCTARGRAVFCLIFSKMEKECQDRMAVFVPL